MSATAGFTLPRPDERYMLWQVYLGLAVFMWGIFAGLAQALDRVLPSTSTLWKLFPGQETYYQGLTAHGVFLAIGFTFAFSNGFMLLVASRAFERAPNRAVNAASFWCMTVGAVLVAGTIVLGKANVLFTAYPPLMAHPLFYLGLVLVVVSTWLTGLAGALLYRAWRRDHPDARTPLQAFAFLATYAMWFIASLGVAVEVLGLLLPWSLGLFDKIDPQLARSLFWFSGHPIVYFWLLPAYLSWYTMIPRQVGGKLLSDPLTRLVFLLFLLLSTPTGLHHQYTDPGIDTWLKNIHLVATMAVFFPSMITAFSVCAALESGGRARGGRGWFGWIRKLPWDDPSVTAQILAMIGFTLGGLSGLVNASYVMNLVVHNTAWMPGHFHLTVGTGVALSFMGISYWLIPHLTGRGLVWRRAAVVQAWLWLIGVFTFSRGQMAGGLESLPRRLSVSQMSYGADIPAWQTSHLLTGIGGTIMFISGLMFGLIVLWTVLRGPAAGRVDMPVADAMVHGPDEGWPVLERWPVWIGLAVVLIVLAWGPFFLTYEWNMVSTGVAP